MSHGGRIHAHTLCPLLGEGRGVAWGSARLLAPDHPTCDVSPLALPDGACVIPGLIDGHLHLLLGGLSLASLDLSHCTTRCDFEQAIESRARSLPDGAWIVAHGWNEDLWGGVPPTHEWFACVGDRPAIAWRMDQHACVVSATVLHRLDLTICPDGGEVVRDHTGAPTGLLRESAAWHIAKPAVPAPSLTDRRVALDAALCALHALGITGAGTMEYGVDLRHVIAPRRDALPLRLAVTLLDREWPLDVTEGVGFAGNDRVWIAGYKSFIDGTLGSRTARLHEPYADDPASCGLWIDHAAAGHLREWAEHILGNGLSPSMHAIGDAALTAALDAVERDDLKVARIEHAQTARAADIARCKDRIVSMQPLHKSDDAPTAPSRLGAARMDRFFRFRDFADAGARLVFGSDWPIVTADPIAGMRAAITGVDRTGRIVAPDQSLTPIEALRAYTCDAAQSLGFPTGAGTLTSGAPADLTVLDRDPRACDWLHDPPRVLMTIVAGRVVHDAR